jgi:single-stranded-DNA-specific exonuclease
MRLRRTSTGMINKIWRIPEQSSVIRDYLADKLKINPVVAQILLNRDMDTESKVREFLYPDLEMLHDSFSFSDMKKVVKRIRDAIQDGERILVYGDYDVDGITGIVVLYTVLQELGATVDYYIPHRIEEGYGLNISAIETAAASGINLLITVDCGITGHEEIQRASALGIDVIVTDHHEPPEVLPEAYGIINPKVPNSGYPFPELAGVGVVFKLVEALMFDFKGKSGRQEVLDKFLDLVALGTIADIVPLLGENRIIAKFGLEKLSKTRNLGLQALLKLTGFADRKMDPMVVSYGLAPRINAVGRMGDPTIGVKLLLASQMEEAERLAGILDLQNRERKDLEARILEEAMELMALQVDLDAEPVIVLAGKKWHTGVVGIVASRICDMYYKPVILISIEDEEARGSARSIEGFNIYEALIKCSDSLLKFGGHEQAAGLVISPEKIDEFRRKINAIAKEILHGDALIPKISIDCKVEFGNLNLDLLEELNVLEPFGMENPEPIFCLSGVRIAEYQTVGEGGRHLKLKVRNGNGTVLDAIGFDMSEYCSLLFENPDNIDLAFTLLKNTWNGYTCLQLKLMDIHSGDNLLFYPTSHNQNGQAASQEATSHLSDTGPEVRGIDETGFTCDKKPRQIQLVDKRDEIDKLKEVIALLQEGRNLLVHVSSQDTAGQLIHRLRAVGEGREALLWREGLSDLDRAAIIRMIEDDLVNVIIVTDPFSAKDISHLLSDVVIYDAPIDLLRFRVQCLAAGDNGRVHLVFGEEDIAKIPHLIEEAYPDRNNLAMLYIALQRICGSSKVYSGPFDYVFEFCQGFLKPELKQHTLLAGLKVFRELELINSIICGTDIRIEFQAKAHKKVRLEDSTYYVEGVHIRERSAEWVQTLRNLDIAGIMELVR